jgi:hypothetical protein
MASIKEVSPVGVFHRSAWAEMNLQEGFNCLETWVRTTVLSQKQLQGVYNFVVRFELKGHESLLGNLSVHVSQNNKAAIQADLIEIANLKPLIPQCYFSGIIRELCEAQVKNEAFSDEAIGELLTMAKFLKSDLFKSDKDIPIYADALIVAMDSPKTIREALMNLISRFTEGWGGFVARNTPLLGRWW